MRPARWKSRILAAVAATAMTFGMVWGGAVAAVAAPPYEQEADLTSISFTQDEVESGGNAQLTGTWALPNNPATPAGFVLDMPEGLVGLIDSFPLNDPSGLEMGSCELTGTQLVCDFDDKYLQEHPLGLQGSFSFWVQVQTEAGQEPNVVYSFGDLEADIDVVPPETETCTDDCEWGGHEISFKWGIYHRDTREIEWRVELKTGATGMEGGHQVTVTDFGASGIEIIPGRTELRGTNKFDANGEPTGWAKLTSPFVTFSEDGTEASFTTQQGWVYAIVYYSEMTDGGQSETYSNEAHVSIQGVEERDVHNSIDRQGGLGDGNGSVIGAFSITKDVTWNGEPVDGLTFGGTYTVSNPQNEQIGEGTFEVADGETWTSDTYPSGSIVHIEEVLPTSPDNLDWADPVISENDFTIGQGTIVGITLTNEATPALGTFSASKKITGDGADLVPTDASFVLDYSYPAGPGYPAGEGSLTLPADGTVVTSEPLPVGAVLTLSEPTPVGVEGAEWGEAEVSPASVTIGRDTAVEVVVTNPITKETPSPSPTPTETTPTPVETTPVPTPTETTPTPTETTPTPTETTPTPTETTPTPVETTPTPVETTPVPTPTETTPTPVETTPAPTETTPVPSGTPSTPAVTTASPTPSEQPIVGTSPTPSPTSTPSPSDLHPTGGDPAGIIVTVAAGLLLVGGAVIALARRSTRKADHS